MPCSVGLQGYITKCTITACRSQRTCSVVSVNATYSVHVYTWVHVLFLYLFCAVYVDALERADPLAKDVYFP